MVNLIALIDLPCNNHSKDLTLVIYFHHLGTVTCYNIPSALKVSSTNYYFN